MNQNPPPKTAAEAAASAPNKDGSSTCPELWHGLDLNWHPELRAAIEKVTAWYKADQGALVLAGGYGCGKTTMAQIVKEQYGLGCILRAEPRLLDDIREGYGRYKDQSERRMIKECCQAGLFILDDVGAGYVKDGALEWYQNIMWQLFDDRAARNAPTLLTTNLDLADLGLRLGGRALSRLMGLLDSQENFVHMFNVPDYRSRNWQPSR